jgi:PmbA protein
MGVMNVAPTAMKEKIIQIFEGALSQKDRLGIDHLFLSALVQTKRSVNIFEGKLDAVDIADELSIGVWLSKNSSWGSATIETTDELALSKAMEQAKESTQFTDSDADYSLAPSVDAKKKYVPDPAIASLSMKDLETWGLSIEKEALSFGPEIQNVPYAGCAYSTWTRIIANSQDLRIVESSHRLHSFLSVMAKGKTDRVVNCHEGESFLKCSDFNPEDLVTDIAGEAIRRIDPQTVKSGTYAILLAPRVASQLLASFSSIFSGDMLYKKLTRLEGQEGQQIASDVLTISQASHQGLSPHEFDAEGMQCQNIDIIKDGVFKNFLHNRYTAKKAGTQSTGNACGGIGQSPIVAPANLYWDGETVAVDDLVQSIEVGLLINELHGASASPISGDFSYGALGYWIENGKICHPIADFTIAGNFFDLLNNIEGFGDDLKFYSPSLLGSYGGRSLLVSNIAVSGN